MNCNDPVWHDYLGLMPVKGGLLLDQVGSEDLWFSLVCILCVWVCITFILKSSKSQAMIVLGNHFQEGSRPSPRGQIIVLWLNYDKNNVFDENLLC